MLTAQSALMSFPFPAPDKPTHASLPHFLCMSSTSGRQWLDTMHCLGQTLSLAVMIGLILLGDQVCGLVHLTVLNVTLKQQSVILCFSCESVRLVFHTHLRVLPAIQRSPICARYLNNHP